MGPCVESVDNHAGMRHITRIAAAEQVIGARQSRLAWWGADRM